MIIGSLAFEGHNEARSEIEDLALMPLMNLLCFKYSSQDGSWNPLILSITRAIRNIVKSSRKSRDVPFQVK